MEQQVLAVLQATLSPQQAIREEAELNLKRLFLLPEGGLVLARILLAGHLDEFAASAPKEGGKLNLKGRYSAGVVLQKYVADHWYLASTSFEEPVTPLEVKAQIRPIILAGLSDPQRKIRAASAFVMSTIAKYDWPDEYPDLLSQLVSLLNSGSSDPVHGAMQVVAEFVKNDLSEDQLLPVVRDLVPALYAILIDPQKHSPATRASTVETFRSVLHMLFTVKDEHPQAVKQALDQLGPAWFDTFLQILQVDAANDLRGSWESLLVRREIYRTLVLTLHSFPRLISHPLPNYIHLCFANLTSLLPTYTLHCLSSSPDAPEPPSPTSDMGNQQVNIEDIASEVFEFLHPAVRQGSAKPALIDDGRASALAAGIVEAVVDWTQISTDNEENWLEDMNEFISEDDPEGASFSLRTAGHDLIGSLIDKYPDPVGQVLYPLAQKKIQQSSAAHRSGDPDWWKPIESVLAMLGGVSDDISELLERDKEAGRATSFDVQTLFDEVVPVSLGQSDTPFLQGRAFVFASQFAALLPTPTAARYFAAAVEVLDTAESAVPVKISAVKTIKNFCRHVSPDLLQPQAGKILGLLLPLLPLATEETLYLIVETMRAVLALDKELLTPETAAELAERVYEDLQSPPRRLAKDPILTAIVEELYESLSTFPPPIIAGIVSRISPRLATAIASPITDDTVHLPGEAIQLANSLLRSRGGPIEEALVGHISAAVLGCLADTEDMDVIQHGMIHLTLLVRKDCDKLIAWHDSQGNNGISCIFTLLARFLAPSFSESGGIFVGELIMHLFRKAGSAIGPVLPELLRAIVERLARAQTPSFIQSLVLPFAYLFGTEHTTETLDLLGSIVVDGQSGLQVVLQCWCETCEDISGSWNIRVSDLGLSKLFALRDERLARVEVRGELIISDVNRDTIMTRSRTKLNPNQYTRVAFPVKAFKLLLKDLQQIGGGKSGGKGKGKMAEGLDIDEDDGDEDWDDDDALGGSDPVDEFGYLSDWLDGGAGGENDAQDDDEDLKADPLAQIDMGQHLTDVLRQCYATNGNGMHEMIGGLTDGEKAILRGVLTI